MKEAKRLNERSSLIAAASIVESLHACREEKGKIKKRDDDVEGKGENQWVRRRKERRRESCMKRRKTKDKYMIMKAKYEKYEERVSGTEKKEADERKRLNISSKKDDDEGQ